MFAQSLNRFSYWYLSWPSAIVFWHLEDKKELGTYLLARSILYCSHQAFSLCVLWASRWCIYIVVMTHIKNVTCCLEKILKTALHKASIVRPPTSHPSNHPSKSNMTCRILLEKFGRTHKWRSLMDIYTWMLQYWPTSKDLLISALSRNWMPSRGPTRSDGW